jgi:hypothetical protein
METIHAESVLFPVSTLIDALTCRERDTEVWKRLNLVWVNEIYDSCTALVDTCVAASAATSLFSKTYLIEQMARLFCFSLDANRWIDRGYIKDVDGIALLKTRTTCAHQLAVRLGDIAHMIEEEQEGHEHDGDGDARGEQRDDASPFSIDSSSFDEENRDPMTSS